MRDSILPPKSNSLHDLFGPTPIIGMVHSRPLPGAPRYEGEPISTIIDAAIADAIARRRGGADGLLVENAWDLPFAKPDDIGHETVAAMTAVAIASTLGDGGVRGKAIDGPIRKRDCGTAHVEAIRLPNYCEENGRPVPVAVTEPERGGCQRHHG